MEHKVIQDPILVVAIDVGSTHSGYAWQWRSAFKAKGSVEFNTNWGTGAPQIHKTSTSLLLKYTDDKKELPSVVAFGHTAESQHAHIQSDSQYQKEKHHYQLFKRFKMLLYELNKSNKSTDVQTESVDGFPQDILTIMFLFIKALKEDFLNKNKTFDTEDVMNKTVWVVTVPALWSQTTRGFMRKAAEMTGIADNNLLLASEPECAAVYCIHLPQEQQINMCNLGMPGTKFLTADIGGGTGDLSAVEVQSDGKLKELCNVAGERVGGQQVNEAFSQAMYDSFEGKTVQQLFEEATPFEIMKLEREFEASKLSIIPDSSEEKIKLSTPKLVREYITNNKIKFVDGAPISYNKNEETLEVNRVFVREKLFKTPCDLINATILKVLKEQPEIKIVVLVGGFAESGIVKQNVGDNIKKTFPDVKVVVPTSPFRAVLTGAVLFGHDPFIYKSRISRATYGVRTNTIFKEATHNPSKKWFDEENKVHRCKDVFDIHVKIGDSVSLNEALEAKTYTPLYKAQKEISIPVYESSEVGPTDGSVMYTTDSGCREIANIKVEIPTAEESSKRGVSVRMIYGGTQLSVIAECAHNGKECPAVIRFN